MRTLDSSDRCAESDIQLPIFFFLHVIKIRFQDVVLYGAAAYNIYGEQEGRQIAQGISIGATHFESHTCLRVWVSQNREERMY